MMIRTILFLALLGGARSNFQEKIAESRLRRAFSKHGKSTGTSSPVKSFNDKGTTAEKKQFIDNKLEVLKAKFAESKALKAKMAKSVVIGPMEVRDASKANEFLGALEAVRDGALSENRASEYDIYEADRGEIVKLDEAVGGKGGPYFLREVYPSKTKHEEHGKNSVALNAFRTAKQKLADRMDPLRPVDVPFATVTDGTVTEKDFLELAKKEIATYCSLGPGRSGPLAQDVPPSALNTLPKRIVDVKLTFGTKVLKDAFLAKGGLAEKMEMMVERKVALAYKFIPRTDLIVHIYEVYATEDQETQHMKDSAFLEFVNVRGTRGNPKVYDVKDAKAAKGGAIFSEYPSANSWTWDTNTNKYTKGDYNAHNLPSPALSKLVSSTTNLLVYPKSGCNSEA